MSRLTISEARRNLAEMKEVLDEEHVEEIEKLLDEKEAERIKKMDNEEFREEFSGIIADGSD
jgi:predicted Zn-dependent peptidase